MAQISKKRKAGGSKKNISPRWKSYLAAVLVVFGILLFLGFSFAHWIERQFLTTNNWVQLVAHIPKDPDVSWSLADYSIDKLFTSIDVEDKVSNALPAQAAFLAKPLTERVETTTTDIAQNFISSDRFQGVWIAANREAHGRLMEAARTDGPIIDGSRTGKFQLRLDSLTGEIRDRMGSRSDQLFDGSRLRSASENAVSITVDLKAKMDTFRLYVAYIDFANATFWLAALVCIVGSLTLSANRYKLAVIVLISLVVISLLQLVGIRVVRPEVLNEIAKADYRPAVAVIYDELTASFRRGASLILLVSAGLLTVMTLTRAKFIRKNKTVIKLGVEVRKLTAWQRLCQARVNLGNYRWQVAGVTGLAVIAYMAFVPDFNWIGLINAGLVILLAVGLINLVSLPNSTTRPAK